MPGTVHVRGSHGSLRVHRSTGHVIDRPDHCGCAYCGGRGYGNISRFDPVPFAREPDVSDFDILGTAYWDDEGSYVPALVQRVTSGPARLANGRVIHLNDDFDDWVPFGLLPAPLAA